MDIKIVGRHFEVSEATRTFVTEKFSAVDRFFKGVMDAEVILKLEDRKHHCEVILHIKNQTSIVIDVARDDMYEAVDIAVGKCERQLRKVKGKISGRKRKNTAPIQEEE